MTLRVARGTQALIDLEDAHPDVLRERVPGSPVALWPQLRDLFAIQLDRMEYPTAPVISAPEPRRKAWLNLARSFLPSRWDAVRAGRNAPLCFLVTGTTTQARANKEYNWLIGDFAQSGTARAVVLQWRPLPSPLGSPEYSRTWSLDPMVTRAASYARLSLRDPATSIQRVVAEVGRRLDVDLPQDILDSIAIRATYAERQRPHVERSFSRILDRVDPQLVVMKSASYGHYASLISIMKDRGIHVAEPQHGWIGPTHAAYNFGAAMSHPDLAHSFPDELLLFGEYWRNGLRYPAKLTVIGKPHLEAESARAPHPNARPREVLVVSSLADPDEMSDFVRQLRSALDGSWEVVFRPHPAERANVKHRYPGLIQLDGVRIDERSDVAEALAHSRAVIGVASTVLFEAVAFGCRVFVRDSPFLEYYVGDLFGPPIRGRTGLKRIVEELAGEAASGLASEELAASIWAPRGVERFSEWASTFIASTTPG